MITCLFYHKGPGKSLLSVAGGMRYPSSRNGKSLDRQPCLPGNREGTHHVGEAEEPACAGAEETIQRNVEGGKGRNIGVARKNKEEAYGFKPGAYPPLAAVRPS